MSYQRILSATPASTETPADSCSTPAAHAASPPPPPAPDADTNKPAHPHTAAAPAPSPSLRPRQRTAAASPPAPPPPRSHPARSTARVLATAIAAPRISANTFCRVGTLTRSRRHRPRAVDLRQQTADRSRPAPTSPPGYPHRAAASAAARPRSTPTPARRAPAIMARSFAFSAPALGERKHVLIASSQTHPAAPAADRSAPAPHPPSHRAEYSSAETRSPVSSASCSAAGSL